MVEPMTDERLAEIRQLEQAATAGPWLFISTTPLYWDRVIGANEQQLATICVMPELDERNADFEFIANARQDVPDLLAEVERLRAENEHLRTVLGQSLKRNTKLGKAVRNLSEQIESWVRIVKTFSGGADQPNYTSKIQATRAYLEEVLVLFGSDVDLITAQAEQFRWEDMQRIRCPRCTLGHLTPQLSCDRCRVGFTLLAE